MQVDRPQVVLLHGLTATARVWDGVASDLGRDHDLLVPELMGHRGGTPWPAGSDAGIEAITDELERTLDSAGLGRPHLVGNSLGGWLGLELAARGRAGSVLALCPAGFWDGPDDPDYSRLTRVFDATRADIRRARPLLGVLFALPPMRRFAFREIANHGERLSREQALAFADGVLGCSAYPEILRGPLRNGARSYDDLDCPVAVLLAEDDSQFPPDVYGPRVAPRVPGAELRVLPGLGHVPMIDDPELIATEIRAWVRRPSAAR